MRFKLRQIHFKFIITFEWAACFKVILTIINIMLPNVLIFYLLITTLYNYITEHISNNPITLPINTILHSTLKTLHL
jgi:hypothetical protein